MNLTCSPTPTGLVPVLPGDTWYFQAWHRDTNQGASTSKFTATTSETFVSWAGLRPHELRPSPAPGPHDPLPPLRTRRAPRPLAHRLLGRLLAKIDLSETAVFIVSDHGFKTGDRRIRSEQVVDIRKAHLDHEREGVFLAAGPHIRADARIEGASVLDLTPTLLHDLGLPVGKDMDGMVLLDAFEPKIREAHPLRYVSTHETGKRRGDGGVVLDGGTGDEVEAGLRALGYMGSDDDEAAEAAFVRVLELDPDSFQARYNLGVTYSQLGRMDEAIESYGAAIEGAGTDQLVAYAWNNLGALHADAGREGEALEAYERAAALAPSHELVHAQLGLAYLQAERAEDAGRALLLVRRLNPSNWSAAVGLATLAAAAGNDAEADALVRDAVRSGGAAARELAGQFPVLAGR